MNRRGFLRALGHGPITIPIALASGAAGMYVPTYHFDGISPADMVLIRAQIAISEQRTRDDVTRIVRSSLRNAAALLR